MRLEIEVYGRNSDVGAFQKKRYKHSKCGFQPALINLRCCFSPEATVTSTLRCLYTKRQSSQCLITSCIFMSVWKLMHSEGQLSLCMSCNKQRLVQVWKFLFITVNVAMACITMFWHLGTETFTAHYAGSDYSNSNAYCTTSQGGCNAENEYSRQKVLLRSLTLLNMPHH